MLTWLLRFVLALFAAAAFASPAHADQPPPALYASLRGRIGRAQAVRFDASHRYVLLEIVDARAGSAPDLGAHQELVEQMPPCTRLFAVITPPRDADMQAFAERIVGREVDELLLHMGEGELDPVPSCTVIKGFFDLEPGAFVANYASEWASMAIKNGNAILPALGASAEFFGSPLPAETDEGFERALDMLDSSEAFAFALEHRMYTFASAARSISGSGADDFALVERELFERPWLAGPNEAAVPDAALSNLFWEMSPTSARASLLALYDRDPDKAMQIAVASPPRDAAIDLLIELTERDRPRWLQRTLRALAENGNERALPFMRAELEHADDQKAALRERIDKIESRAALGIRDAETLGAYLWKHRDDRERSQALVEGMRIEAVVATTSSCTAKTYLGDGVQLELHADCDAETKDRLRWTGGGREMTIVGIVRHTFVSESSPKVVHVVLAHASATTSEIPPAADSSTPAALLAGCGCQHRSAPTPTALLVLLLCVIRAATSSSSRLRTRCRRRGG